MGHILFLVRVLEPFVRVNGIAPDSTKVEKVLVAVALSFSMADSLADQLSQTSRDVVTIAQFFNAGRYFAVNAVDNVMAMLETLKKLVELRVVLLAYWTIIEVRFKLEVVCLDDAVNIPERC